MSGQLVDRIVEATLYEGYVLYPYRASSSKNRVRWSFGALHPRAYSEATGGSEPWELHTECLLTASDSAEVEVVLRFLQVVTRTVGAPREGESSVEMPQGYVAVEALDVGGRRHRSWEEATERSAGGGPWAVGTLLEAPHTIAVELGAERSVEPIAAVDPADASAAAEPAGVLVRTSEAVSAEAEVGAVRVADGAVRIAVRIRNTSAVPAAADRARSLLCGLVSTHAVLSVRDGRFVSLTDPPAALHEAAEACSNRGLWPVLVDESDDVVLASPIILEDHPRVAPESPGELFDSTEIDEILSLRILALTDDEKREMRAADPRTRALLDRTEAMDAEAMARLHGAIRELRPHRATTVTSDE